MPSIVRTRMRKLSAAALVAGLAVTGTLPPTASAHRVFGNSNGPGAYDNGRYVVPNLDVHWAFDSGFPDGGARRAVRGGADPWTNLNRVMRFTFQSRDLSTDRKFDGDKQYCTDKRPPIERNGRPLSLVFWTPLKGSKVGAASACYKRNSPNDSYHMVGYRLAIDSTVERWYTGSSGTVPDGRVDMQSVAAHEFGHATGWGRHYDGKNNLNQSMPCEVNNKNRGTMCSVTVVGQSRTRTLSRHDRHTFKGAYGPR